MHQEPEVSATATLCNKFQISIPKAVRDELHWEAGQEFVFIAKGARKGGHRDRKDRY